MKDLPFNRAPFATPAFAQRMIPHDPPLRFQAQFFMAPR
jgi:hypothetical protein